MAPWTYGMKLMTLEAIEERRICAICQEARIEARAAAVIKFADRLDVAQAVLDADQVGQRAYWARRASLNA